MEAEEYARAARAMAHLAAGWRDRDDLETLAALPDGTAILDLLSGTARLEDGRPMPLRLAPALQAALAERLGRKGPATADRAELILRWGTGAIATDRSRIVHFDFDLEARVGAGDGEYRAARREDHVWHSREPD